METPKPHPPIPPDFDWYSFKKLNADRLDLVDLFYFEFQLKVNTYFAEMFLYYDNEVVTTQLMQKEYLENCIIDFQKVYPLKSWHRKSGNYFDDLCRLELEKINRNISQRENEKKKVENKIKLAVDEFNTSKIANSEVVKSGLKLDWKGTKIQLYSVLRQLKNDYELIGNSYNELADFLIQNVKSFGDTKKETVEKELKKVQQPPKNRRVKINPNSSEI